MGSKIDNDIPQDNGPIEIPPCSVNNCLLPTDVVLESCDGIRYGTHTANLEVYSAGFPIAASAQYGGEIVHMPEHSAVLSLLLWYMHNERQPDSSKISFEVLAPLSEAVEKYMVFAAMEVCRIRMKEALPYHPLDVLAYAIKHEYPELSRAAAPLTLSMSLDTVSTVLKDRPDIILRWVQYREHWLDVLKFVYENPHVVLHPGGFSECESWVKLHRQVVVEVGANLNKLQEFGDILSRAMKQNLDGCSHCRIRVGAWEHAYAKRIANVPIFDAGI